jgi:hypothetical protein
VRIFSVIALVCLLLGTPGAVAADSCSCAGRDLRLGGDAGTDVAAALRLPVTLELRSGGTNRKISDELSRITGKRIVILPSKPDEAVNVDIKRASLWDVLEMFSERGAVKIEGEDFSKLQSLRKALAGGERISVCINRAPLGRVIADLYGLSGQPLRVTAGDENAPVTLSAKAITLWAILSRLSSQTGAQTARSNRLGGAGVLLLAPVRMARLSGGAGCAVRGSHMAGRGSLAELNRGVCAGGKRLTLARPRRLAGCAAGPPRDGREEGTRRPLIFYRLGVGAWFVARIRALTPSGSAMSSRTR